MDYDPKVFLADTLENASRIILTREAGMSSEERWKVETPWVLDRVSFGEGPIIDYGCGIGRVAKELPFPVVGVDISVTMRMHSEIYVSRPDWAAINPQMLRVFVENGFRAKGALAIWVLQHAFDPEKDIDLLASALVPKSPLWVMNRFHRVVPVNHEGEFGWADDGKVIGDMLAPKFSLDQHVDVPDSLCTPGAYLRRYIKR